MQGNVFSEDSIAVEVTSLDEWTVSEEILHFKGDPLDYDKVYKIPELDAALTPGPTTHKHKLGVFEGVWFGCFFYFYDYTRSLVEGQVHVKTGDIPDGGQMRCEGASCLGNFLIVGDIDFETYQVMFTKIYDNDDGWEVLNTYCRGRLDVDSNKIVGQWGYAKDELLWDFYLGRMPSSIRRFHPLTGSARDDTSRSSAQANWDFVRKAILHQVRQRLWSWSFFQSRAEERQRFIKLDARKRAEGYYALSAEESLEIDSLKYNLPYMDVHLYSLLAMEAVRKRCYQ